MANGDATPFERKALSGDATPLVPTVPVRTKEEPLGVAGGVTPPLPGGMTPQLSR